jgi:hypothetical protein
VFALLCTHPVLSVAQSWVGLSNDLGLFSFKAGGSKITVTLAGWVGAASELLAPLVDALRRHVLSASKIHADDTPVPVLAPGNGKTKTGRLWTYVRDERTAGENTPPAVWFAYSPDRKGEHPRLHLKNFKGALQADAYAGFHHLYDSGDMYEVACWAQLMRITLFVENLDRLLPARVCRTIQLAQIADRSLTRTIRRAHRFHQRPVRVRLAVLTAAMRAEIHSAMILP